MYSARMSSYEIEPMKVASLLQDKTSEPFVLLDVREPWEAATCALPGSVLMPMGDIPSRAHAELDPEQHIVAYCHHGVRSLNVAVWLRNQGFELAQSMTGGIDAWSREIDPTVTRY